MSVQTIEPGTNLEIIAHLDFQPEVPCSAKMRPPACEQVARWYLTCRSCGWTVPYCDEHLVKLRAAAVGAVTVQCIRCLTSFPSFDAAISVTRIRRES